MTNHLPSPDVIHPLIPIITKQSRIIDKNATVIDNIFITKPIMFVASILISEVSEACPIGVCVTLSGKFPYAPYNYLTNGAGS